MLPSTCICRARPLLATHSPFGFSSTSASLPFSLLQNGRHPSSFTLITMHASQHPYRIHTTTAATQSPVTLPTSPHTTPASHHTHSSLPSSCTPLYHPHPSHLTTHASPDPSALSFSVMQYNILAGPLATSEHFPFAKPHLLDWSYRRQAIINKIKEMMTPYPPTTTTSTTPTTQHPLPASPPQPSTVASLPTFLCFQELTDYWTYFEPQLSALGYKGIYIKRPSLHMSNWSGTEKHDGCMVAYQSSMIRRVVDVDQINYDDAHDRVGLVVLLEWSDPPEGVCPYVMVGTTHLYWDHKLLAVQVNELDQLLTSITRMQRKHESEPVEGGGVVGPIPTVISGDFNNGPNSQIYSRIVDHHTFHPIATTSLSTRSRTAAAKGSPTGSDNGAHDKHFLYRYESSYAAGGKEPPCTTATHRRCWTIDYIFYSHSATQLPTSTAAVDTQPNPIQLLRVTHTNPLPTESDLRSESGPAGWNEDERLKRTGQIQEGIPNSKQPSDHVPLFARFEVVGQREERREAGVGGGSAGVLEEAGGGRNGDHGGRRALLDKR